MKWWDLEPRCCWSWRLAWFPSGQVWWEFYVLGWGHLQRTGAQWSTRVCCWSQEGNVKSRCVTGKMYAHIITTRAIPAVEQLYKKRATIHLTAEAVEACSAFKTRCGSRSTRSRSSARGSEGEADQNQKVRLSQWAVVCSANHFQYISSLDRYRNDKFIVNCAENI